VVRKQAHVVQIAVPKYAQAGDLQDPRTEYTHRLGERQAQVSRQSRMERLVGYLRVGVFCAGIAVAALSFGGSSVTPAWLALPTAAFIGLVLWHREVNQTLDRARRAAAFYALGLARLDDDWRGRGEPGTRFLNEEHPNAADLDLFGPGSLFERLCQARTRDGQATLADWLRSPASAEEVRLRQAAVTELMPRTDLREDLDILGDDVRAVVDAEGFAAWGTAASVLNLPYGRWIALAISFLSIAALACWLVGIAGPSFFLAAVLVEVGFAAWLHRRVERVLGVVGRKARDLAQLATILARLEREQFQSQRLRQLRRALDVAGPPPSASIAQLSRIIDRLHWRQNQIFTPLAALLLWGTQHAFALEAWRGRSGPQIGRWLSVVGEFEALGALASYAFENPSDPFPELVDEGALFEGEALGHPLIALGRSVANDVRLGDSLQLLVVSGSNMSGKSTLLRTVGMNAVLALAGAPVRARRLTLAPVQVAATLRIQDSLEAGRSRFYTEISRIRQFIELGKTKPPVLFLLDELFQGTNSHDRRIGAEAVVRTLVNCGCIGLITTHDLALTQIATGLGPRAANVHFADRFENGDMIFDYRMRPGVLDHTNALALMRAVGLDVPFDGDSERL
jgi:hypothetical protein